MDFNEKARIRMDHWIVHNEQHQHEYETFVKELESAEYHESARHMREMVDLTAKSTQSLKKALEGLG